MNYKKYELEHYNLHFINTDHFKTVSIRINFKTKLEKESMMKRYLLAALFPFICEKYPTERDITIKCEELYDANLSVETYKSGFYHILMFYMTFINEKYTEEGMNEECIKFLKDILFHPQIIENSFDEEKVERMKRVVLEDLKSVEETPSSYSQIKLIEHMAKDELYGLHPYLLKEEINKITAKELYNCYQDMINNDMVDIFVIGNVDDKKIIDKLNDLNIQNKHQYKESHIINWENIRKERQQIIESYPSNQSKLAISFKLKDLTDFERKYVLNIYSYILGGSGDSKLFKNVREKHSLCYYINSNYNNIYNVMTITAGIDGNNLDLVMKLINEELDNMKKGKFDEEEIEKGKQTYLSACQEIMDSQSSIINIYVAHEYLKNDLIDEKMRKIKTITKEDIMSVAKKINMDTIYLLKGEQENGAN